MTPEIRAMVVEAANKANLDPILLVAQVTVESGGNPFAWNPEPQYRYFWDVRQRKPFRPLDPSEIASEVPPKDFYALDGDADQEWWAQQASWGLGQIMGAVARELGFVGVYLTELVDPDLNLRLMCKKFAGELQWARGDVRSALASYNGGRKNNAPGGVLRNDAYALKVLAQRNKEM